MTLRVTVRVGALPGNFIPEIALPKDAIHQHLDLIDCRTNDGFGQLLGLPLVRLGNLFQFFRKPNSDFGCMLTQHHVIDGQERQDRIVRAENDPM
jgi:hypothetical protein